MADKSIGDLNFAPGTVDDSNTLFVVQQSGAAYKLSGHEFIIAMESVLDGHGGISSIVYTPPVAPSLTGTMVITLADQSTTTVSIQNGKGIVSIAKTGTSGLVDTYRITYNDNTTSTFTVTNGAKGDTGDAWYVWIRYSGSQPTQDSDMGTTPDNWMGIYSGTSSTAPVHYTSYQWFQIKGATGDTGAPATITDADVEYQTSSSGTVAPSGSWTTTVPTVNQGDFLWTRTTLTFNTGSPIVWYAVAYQAVDGQGAPSSATPLMDAGTGSAGTGTAFSRDDHIHPTDTTRQAVLVSGSNIKTVGGTTLLGSGDIAFPVTSVNNETGAVVLDADDVGAMSKWVLLWENASPSSSMDQQTISLDLSVYDAVLIGYRIANAESLEANAIGIVGQNLRLMGTRYQMTRRALNIAVNSITIGKGYYTATYGNSQETESAGSCIPTAIYGIKGVNNT